MMNKITPQLHIISQLKKVLCCWMLCGFWSICYGLPLDPCRVLTVNIASYGLTRVSLAHKIIHDVFVFPTETTVKTPNEPSLVVTSPVSVQVHLHKGHVFVTPQKNTPLFLTILSEEGVVQDLKLVPTSKHPQPIVLDGDPPQHQDIPQENLQSFLKAFLSGYVPAGFKMHGVAEPLCKSLSCARTCTRSCAHSRKLTIIPMNTFTNGMYQVNQYALTATSKTPLQLTPSSFSQPGDLALVLTQRCLSKGETVLLFVVKNATLSPVTKGDLHDTTNCTKK